MICRGFAFPKNTFHTSESAQSNQSKQRKQNTMVGCVEGVKHRIGVKTIFEAFKLLFLQRDKQVTASSLYLSTEHGSEE